MITTTLRKAVEQLKAGGLVAFPTETVYGLGADATNLSACSRIFTVKERPFDHPLIVHIASIAALSDWARDIPPEALMLGEAFWPGPLTLILKKKPHVLDIITGNQDTIGLRVPNHPIAQQLLQLFGGGIAAPSANKFTRISPTRAHAVWAELGEEVDCILDGGACEVGLESTIIDMSKKPFSMLRPGMIALDKLQKLLPELILFSSNHSTKTRAPGMHPLHYAPKTKTVRVHSSLVEAFFNSLRDQDFPVAFMCFKQRAFAFKPSDTIHTVIMPDDPHAYAREFYHRLRLLDNQQFKRIVIETPPEQKAWAALHDRLFKASDEITT